MLLVYLLIIKINIIKGDFNGSLMSSITGNRLNLGKLIKVKAVTLDNILNDFSSNNPISIDLLSLDAEGYELQILNGLNMIYFIIYF